MSNAAVAAAVARVPVCAVVVALLAVGLTGTALRAQEDRGSAGAWQVVGSDQTGPGQLRVPAGVAVDGQGNLLAALPAIQSVGVRQELAL